MSQATLLNHLVKTLERTQARVDELQAMITVIKQLPQDTKAIDMLEPLKGAKRP